MKKNSSLARGYFLVLGFFALPLGLGGCSFIIDTNAIQCYSNADCTHFGQASCDTVKHVCVADSTDGADGGASDATPSCQGPGGCFQCAPTVDREFLSSCTDSTCVPFDNTRLTNNNGDGTLKPLP